ncbi:hypothetical protein KP509_31G033500 [Ceratopteris richardii]|uniref:Uncharacterized protein n=1 Tax=Ceratopteris richardii TaxID=49495 RepID=A0A8T2QYY0_CERRI|nr:hypothetical protein KP509_31G033500 [Ceratopteris richardii]KAH7288607.1 hypothetical protein KP509_31G033500 [Ceratopteris richardii]
MSRRKNPSHIPHHVGTGDSLTTEFNPVVKTNRESQGKSGEEIKGEKGNNGDLPQSRGTTRNGPSYIPHHEGMTDNLTIEFNNPGHKKDNRQPRMTAIHEEEKKDVRNTGGKINMENQKVKNRDNQATGTSVHKPSRVPNFNEDGTMNFTGKFDFNTEPQSEASKEPIYNGIPVNNGRLYQTPLGNKAAYDHPKKNPEPLVLEVFHEKGDITGEFDARIKAILEGEHKRTPLVSKSTPQAKKKSPSCFEIFKRRKR